MNRWLLLLCASVCLLPLACAHPRHECSAPFVRHYHHASITSTFRDASIRDVMEAISTEAHRTIVVEAGIVDRVSVDFRGCPWRLAAEIAAMSARCTVRETEAGLLVRRPGPVTLEFAQADLAQAIRTLAAYGDCEVAFVPEVKGQVSTGFVNWEWRQALEALAARAGGHVFQEGFGHLVVAAPSPEVTQGRMGAKNFNLGSIRPAEWHEARISGNGVGGPPLRGPAEGITLVEALRYMLTRADNSAPPRRTLGRLDYFRDGNVLIVVDTPAVLDRIGRLIAELDVEGR